MIRPDALPALHAALAALTDPVDGWLLFDFRGMNPIMAAVVGPETVGSRRSYVYVPHQGSPAALVHGWSRRVANSTEEQRMIHTSITADEEIRRLRRLGERTRDWRDPDEPPVTPSAAGAWMQPLSDTLRSLVEAISRFARTRAARHAGTGRDAALRGGEVR